jgi:hypothetical protein
VKINETSQQIPYVYWFCWITYSLFNVRERTSFYPTIKFLPGWGSGQYGPYGDPAGPGTPAQGEPVARKGRQSSRREPRTPFFSRKTPLTTSRVSLQTFCLLNVCEKTFFKILPQMYCFSTRLPTSMSVTVKPSIICLSVWCYSLFKLLQSLPTTQHIYELSFNLVQCSSLPVPPNFKSGPYLCYLRWLTWKGLLWDGRW